MKEEKTVYILIDTDGGKWDDILVGVYESIADAVSVKQMYESTVAVPDKFRFQIKIEKVL